jgi:hypothetical protein
MLRALFSRVPFLREIVRPHRNAQGQADSDERRARWNQVIAEHQNPMAQHKETSTQSAPVAGAPHE